MEAPTERECVQHERNHPSEKCAPRIMRDEVGAAALPCDAEDHSEEQSDSNSDSRQSATALVHEEV